MTISREAMRHNLQMVADGEPIHVGEDGLLQKGEGDQTRVQEIVDQTLAAICEAKKPIYVRVLEGDQVKFVTAGCLQERIQSVTSHLFDIPPDEINNELSDVDFERKVRIASGDGDLGLLHFLLSQGRVLSQRGFDKAVCAASNNGYLEVVRFLLPEGRELSQGSLDNAVEEASKNGHLEVVRFLLSEGRVLSEGGLDNAVEEASACGHLEVVRFLLSEGRTLPGLGLDDAVETAFSKGYFEVVLFLLSQGIVIIDARNEIALQASSDGHPDLLEAVLRNGPISQSTLGSCRTQATRGENRQRILDLLDSAPVIPDPAPGASAAPLAGGTSLKLSDVKVQPQTYLDQLAAYGMPRRVSLLDNPQVIDLGGVTKQYLTTLFGALLEKGLIRIDNEGTPSTEQEQDRKVLQKVGQAFSHIAKRNSTRTDKFLVGELFSKRFYKLVHMVAAKKEGLMEAALEGSIYVEMDEPADYIEPQIEAAKCFCAGLDDATKALFAANENLQEAFQGQPCTKEALLAAVRFTDVGEQEAWLREMIEGSDQQWRQRFVLALTGNKTLMPGLKLEVRRGWRPVFELHTCFNSLDVPAGMTKEDFIAGVNASLIGEDYNIG